MSLWGEICLPWKLLNSASKETNLLLVQADQVGTSYDLKLLLVNLLSLAVWNGLSSIMYWYEGKLLEDNSVIYTF